MIPGVYRSGPPDYSMTTQQGPWSSYRDSAYRSHTVRIIPKISSSPRGFRVYDDVHAVRSYRMPRILPA